MPQKYNPLIMQMAANMMSQGSRARPAFGVRGGLASGLTAAGNSLLGALMMKKQGKMQSTEWEAIQKALLGEEGGEGAPLPVPGPAGVGGAPMGGDAGSRMAASMSGIPSEFLNMKPPGPPIDPQTKEFMGRLFPEYAKLETSFSDTAGAPTGGSTVAKEVAPETKAVQKSLADHMPKELRGVVAAMMASGDPQMKQMGLATAMSYMPQKLKLSERYKPLGYEGYYFDNATGELKAAPQRGTQKVVFKAGERGFVRDYDSGRDILVDVPMEVETYRVTSADEEKSKDMNAEVSNHAFLWMDPNTKEITYKDTGVTADIGPAPIEGAGYGKAGKVARTELEKKINAARNNLVLFDDIERLFNDPDYLTVPGNVKSWLFNTVDRMGANLTGDQAKFLGGIAEFKAAAFEGINLYIKEITGAQMSEAEAGRLRQAMPDPETDGEVKFRAKLARVQGAARAAIERYDRMIRKGHEHLDAQVEADKAASEFFRDNPLSAMMGEEAAKKSGKEGRVEERTMDDGTVLVKGADGVWREKR